MKLKITLNEKQSKLLIDATDLYSRLLSGQLDEILLKTIPMTKKIDRSKARKKIDELKEIIFPELEKGEIYGIYSRDLTDDAKILYDIHQSIRYKYSWSLEPKGGFQTWFDEPIKTSKLDLPKVTL